MKMSYVSSAAPGCKRSLDGWINGKRLGSDEVGGTVRHLSGRDVQVASTVSYNYTVTRNDDLLVTREVVAHKCAKCKSSEGSFVVVGVTQPQLRSREWRGTSVATHYSLF
jgi:hypothetical protein